MRKKFFFLAALLTATVINLHAATVTNVKYIDANGAEQTCAEATVVESSSTLVSWTAGWYVVTGTDVTLSQGAVCTGAVHLILADGAKLTATGAKVNTMYYGGISMLTTESGNSISIYGQANNSGKLIASGTHNSYDGVRGTAGIGGYSSTGSAPSYTTTDNTITINGGDITATGGCRAAGIGGACNFPVPTITINGGKIVAIGGDMMVQSVTNHPQGGAGIGGGYHGTCTNLTINGGSIEAQGSAGAAGIGSGCKADVDEFITHITINGGTVNATGSYGEISKDKEKGGGAGIGTGYGSLRSYITITGGNVTATGGKNAAGIGGGRNSGRPYITISGGNITAIGGIYGGPGVGSGWKEDVYQKAGTTLTITGGNITATGGDNGTAPNISNGIGNGYNDTGTTTITIDDACLVKADVSTNPPTTIITNFTNLAGKRYATVSSPEDVTFSETGDKADITALKDKKANATIARTFYKDGERNSICLPFALSTLEGTPLADGTLEEFSSAEIVNKGKDNETLELTMTPATAIEAGKPYLITWTSGENIVSPVFNNVTITTDEAGASAKSGGVTFCGTFVPKAVTEGDKGVLFVGLEGALNWPNVGGNINGFRSYFTVDVDAQSPIRRGMNARIGGGKNTPTELDEAAVAAKVQKLIEAGKVVIISNGVRYDLNGNMVK